MIAAMAREVGALSVCDNTFLSPVRQKPLNLGCDIDVCAGGPIAPD